MISVFAGAQRKHDFCVYRSTGETWFLCLQEHRGNMIFVDARAQAKNDFWYFLVFFGSFDPLTLEGMIHIWSMYDPWYDPHMLCISYIWSKWLQIYVMHIIHMIQMTSNICHAYHTYDTNKFKCMLCISHIWSKWLQIFVMHIIHMMQMTSNICYAYHT